MKQSDKKFLALSLALIGFMTNIKAQVSIPVNGAPGNAANWVGWDATRLFPVTVAHKGNFPINFQTNGTQRMTIMNTTGFVGINTPNPQAYLHINDGFFSNYIMLTNATTGVTATDGFAMQLLFSNVLFNHRENGQMNFYTGSGTSNAIRFTIDGFAGPTQGYVGIGRNFTSPLSLLHISAFNDATGNVFRTDGPGSLNNNWQMFAGADAGSSLEKLRITNPGISNNINFHLVQDGDMSFFTGGFSSGTPGSNQRMIIYGSASFIPGMVRIFENSATINSNTPTLQVGGPIETNARHNAASDHTVLFGYTSPDGDPGLYTGGPTDGFRMRYMESLKGSNGDALVFTKTDLNSAVPDGCIAFSNYGNANLGGSDILSMKIEGNGNVGIGPTFSSGGTLPPRAARRLEVLTDHSGPNIPCVRYSFQQVNGAASPGRFTDFVATANGDYVIGARDLNLVPSNTPNRTFSERYVGINTLTPGNTLEINSQFASSATPNGQPATPSLGAPTGWAGLRFSDLQSTSIPQANPGIGVLSVDKFGDVIYVPGTGNGSGNACGSTSNPLTTSWEIPLATHNYSFDGVGNV